MRRYFFCYYNLHGEARPCIFAKEDEITLGGRPRDEEIVQGPVEISEEEFNGTIANLEAKHPLEIDMTTILLKK